MDMRFRVIIDIIKQWSLSQSRAHPTVHHRLHHCLAKAAFNLLKSPVYTCRASLVDPSKTTVMYDLDYTSDGTYTAAIQLTLSGSYALKLLLNNSTASASTTLTVPPGPADADRCAVSPELSTLSAEAQTPVNVTVHARDAFGNGVSTNTGNVLYKLGKEHKTFSPQ